MRRHNSDWTHDFIAMRAQAAGLEGISASEEVVKRAKSLHAGEIFKRVADNAKSDIAKQVSRGAALGGRR